MISIFVGYKNFCVCSVLRHSAFSPKDFLNYFIDENVSMCIMADYPEG